MLRAGPEQKLFDLPAHYKNGLVYRPDFITPAEEFNLLEAIETLPLQKARFRGYRANRRAMGFGWDYDRERDRFIPGPPLPEFLQPLQRKVAKWLDIPKKHIVEALVNEYRPNTAIGWHVDREKFEHIVGVSLGGWCTMRFRPHTRLHDKNKILSLELEQRSAYCMQKQVRWQFEHCIVPTKTLRFSITFRTLPQQFTH